MADDTTHPDIMSKPVGPALSATSDSIIVAPDPEPAPEPAANATPTPTEGEPPATEAPATEGAEGEAGEEGEGEAAAEPQVATPPRRAIAPRMSEMAAARRLAEEREAVANANVTRLTALVEKLTAERPAAEPQPEPPAARPVRESFADPDSYDAALIEWAAGQSAQRTAAEMQRQQAEARQTEERGRAETAARTQFETVQQTWNQARDKLLENEEYADWAEVAENPDLPISETMVPALLSVENGPKVLYHLGNNLPEAARIAKLTPVQQAIEIGKISAVLAQPPRPQRTAAPKPLETVGARNNAGPRSPDDMTMEEYAAQRLPKLRESNPRISMFGSGRQN